MFKNSNPSKNFSSVDKKKLKSTKNNDRLKDREVVEHRAPPRKDERSEKDSRKSRSRERDQRRKKSTSQSVRKNQRSKSRSASPKRFEASSMNSDRSRNEKDKRREKPDQKSRRSRSKPVQKERSVSPKRSIKRKSPTPKKYERNSRRTRSPRHRSVSPKRNESRNNRKRSQTPRKRSIERKRSSSPKGHSPERKKERSMERRRFGSPSFKVSRKRSTSRDRQQPIRNQQRRSSSRNRRQERRKSPVARKRSASRSKSPISRKVSRYSRSPASRYSRGANRNRPNERRTRSRSLSYSPARRNPEKYRELLDTKDRSNEKNRKTAPVVKLHPTTSDRDSSENETRGGSRSIEKVEEFLPIDRNQDKELNRLKALKSELAAKAKESLEKKIISEIASTSTNTSVPGKSYLRHVSPVKNIEPERAREMKIVAQTVAISTKEKQAAKKEREDQKKISIKPFKINDGSSPTKSGDVEKIDAALGVKSSVLDNDDSRKSRSHSRASKR